MIASMLVLSRKDIKEQRITDAYSLHRIVYDLFDDVREGAGEKQNNASGILFADKGGDYRSRKLLIVSDRKPRAKPYGEIISKQISAEFLQFSQYSFQVVVNPTKRDKDTGKRVAIKSSEAIKKWFTDRCSSQWGFSVEHESLQIDQSGVIQFKKKDHQVTMNRAQLSGLLSVTDQNLFIKAFQQGLGRGRSFGFGLLEILPIQKQ